MVKRAWRNSWRNSWRKPVQPSLTKFPATSARSSTVFSGCLCLFATLPPATGSSAQCGRTPQRRRTSSSIMCANGLGTQMKTWLAVLGERMLTVVSTSTIRSNITKSSPVETMRPTLLQKTTPKSTPLPRPSHRKRKLTGRLEREDSTSWTKTKPQPVGLRQRPPHLLSPGIGTDQGSHHCPKMPPVDHSSALTATW